MTGQRQIQHSSSKKDKKVGPGNYRLVRLIRSLERVLLEHISRHMKEKKVIGSCQCGFTKSKSCLSNLITFYSKMTGFVGEGRVVEVVCLKFSQAFSTISHNVLKSQVKV